MYLPESGSLLSAVALVSSQSLCFLKLPDLLPWFMPLINVWIKLLICTLLDTFSCWKQVCTYDLPFCWFVWLFSSCCCSITLLKFGLTGHGCTTWEVWLNCLLSCFWSIIELAKIRPLPLLECPCCPLIWLLHKSKAALLLRLVRAALRWFVKKCAF